MLNLADIKDKITPIAQKYAVNQVEVFGSYANGTAKPKSDIDFLVEFSTPIPSIFKVMGFREELRKTLGIEVDVVTLPLTNPNAINIDRREKIL